MSRAEYGEGVESRERIDGGVASIPVTAFVLWRGVGARRLTIAAALLLGVLPAARLRAAPGALPAATTSATP